MGILNGAMTVSRLRVLDPDLPEGWRDTYRDQLDAFAFRAPPQGLGREEVEGWCQVRNLLDTDFGNFNDWLLGDWAVFALRVDKKRLPANLVRATLDKRARAWAAEREIERCPAKVRAELKERIEEEMLAQTLPAIRVTEVAWHVGSGWVIVNTHAEAMVERVRKRFYRTFGKRLAPWSPLDWLDSDAAVDALLAGGSTLADGGAS